MDGWEDQRRDYWQVIHLDRSLNKVIINLKMDNSVCPYV